LNVCNIELTIFQGMERLSILLLVESRPSADASWIPTTLRKNSAYSAARGAGRLRFARVG
jgi:hypothetical protein